MRAPSPKSRIPHLRVPDRLIAAVAAGLVALAAAPTVHAANRPAPKLSAEAAAVCKTRFNDLGKDYAGAYVPKWLNRYSSGMTVLRKARSGRLVVRAPAGLAGITQSVAVPRKEVRIIVRGAAQKGKATMLLGWTDRGAVHEVQQPLRLRGGRTTGRFQMPAGSG